jgi:hypothetical protein
MTSTFALAQAFAVVQLQKRLHNLQEYALVLEALAHRGGLGCLNNVSHRKDIMR